MSRKTQQNSITNPELLKQVNEENIRLLNDFVTYMRSVQRSDRTINGYINDIQIFYVWNLQNNKNKFFVDITKRDIIAYQNWLISTNKNSPSRVRRLKSALSSMSNYIENILDSEYKDYRPIVRKVESPVNQAVREKSIFTDEQLDNLLNKLVIKKHYKQACMLALAMCSGRRKSELVRFKVSYFTDENIICGSLYKTPEKIKTKGRGLGKYLTCYVLVTKFKIYFDLWMKERNELGITSDWLFPIDNEKDEQMQSDTLNSWALTFTHMLGEDFYWHSLRHYFCTQLARLGLPDSIIQEIIGWESADMVKIYKDLSADEQLEKYFDKDGIKEVKQATLEDLNSTESSNSQRKRY